MFLERFSLPNEDEEDIILEERKWYNGRKYGYIDNPYPCTMFSSKDFYDIFFKKITIFYGGNGSGKSTLLNIIAEKLNLKKVSPFNSSEMFDLFIDKCNFELGFDDEGDRHRIPDGSRIITSDDIFDYMLTVRANNDEISEQKDIAKRGGYAEIKYGSTVKFNGLDDYEDYRMQILSRRKSVSRRQFIRQTAGDEVKLNSNGETALNYFEEKLKFDTLYCLDEPENSMSPKMQLELVKMLEKLSHYCGCQFIIATHSPFILALENARIYNLDKTPVEIQNWWELENTRIYYDFFKEHSNLFEQSR